MKRFKKFIIFACIFAIVLVLYALGNTTSENSSASSQDSAAASAPKATPDSTNEYAGVDKFIELFNTISDTDISDAQEIDIKDDEHYRTEFRLGAFDNARAKETTVGQARLEMINYGSIGLSDFRVYGTADSYESFQKLLESCAAVFDSSITSDMIQEEVYNVIDSGEAISTSFSFYLNNIACTYQKEDSRYTFMMDQEFTKFLK